MVIFMFWSCLNAKIEYGERTLIMGIVNVTPDSFSDGGSFFSPTAAVERALELEAQGADIIDFGAQSTRPGYTEISAEEEWQRLESVLAEFRKSSQIPVSVDTYYPAVAEKSLAAGANIINDVSGKVNPEMAKIVKNRRCGWILMHNGAGDCAEVGEFFNAAVLEAQALGVGREQLCLDMGIGFGKTRQQDLSLIANIADYKIEGVPLLLGTSRKRVIGEFSCQPIAENRIYGNIAADTAAILGGADIIRLHDVENEIQGIRFADALKGIKNG